MHAHWSIRRKLSVCVGLLLITVGVLALTGFRGAYGYRALVRGVSLRSEELSFAWEFPRHLYDMRAAISGHQDSLNVNFSERLGAHVDFRNALVAYQGNLKHYREKLSESERNHNIVGASDNGHEWDTLASVEQTLQRIHDHVDHEDWWLNQINIESLQTELDLLSDLSFELPQPLQRRMHELGSEVRTQYRAWIILAWLTWILAMGLIVLQLRLVYVWIFQPLRTLIRGSREVASGDFRHHIELNTHDEMAELARAMNNMTRRFREIRDDLDGQVRQRTREVVRSEQLASVGFLAAGVAHEINNPLASIAMCAESLEERVHHIIVEDDVLPDAQHNEEITILRNYLRMIQDEAFRCKGITDGLLDFSRTSDTEREQTDLGELVQSVIEMVRHLGNYKGKNIVCEPAAQSIQVNVNPQEWKQVVLNVVTNALDSLDIGGTVWIALSQQEDSAVLVVRDDGCGMTEEVQQHLFDPFFTRRRDGKGTGLGMSITYRIVSEHGGNIWVASDGTGHGSEITITVSTHEETKHSKHLQIAHAA